MGVRVWGFPKLGGTFFGGPHNKDCSFFGVYIGVPLFTEITGSSCLKGQSHCRARYPRANGPQMNYWPSCPKMKVPARMKLGRSASPD